MRNTISFKIFPFIRALIATLIVFSFITGASVSASEKKDMQTAASVGDHIRVAQDFEKKAEKADSKARSHIAMGDMWKDTSRPLFALRKHCSEMAQKYTQAAKEDRVMAMEHRKMAEAAQMK